MKKVIREENIVIMVSKDEKELIMKRADDYGLLLSPYLRLIGIHGKVGNYESKT